MPYEVQGPTPVIPALAGLASAYFQIKNENARLKNEQQQTQINKAIATQQYGLGPDLKPNGTPLAQPPGMGPQPAPTSPPPGVSPAMEAKLVSDSKAGRTGSMVTPTTAPGAAPSLPGKQGSPERDLAIADFYDQQAATAPDAYTAGRYTALATQYRENASTASLGGLKGAETGYYGARTQLTEAEVKNTAGKFQHDLDMIHARGVSAESIARIHAAYRRAGGGSGSAAAEQRAEMAALNAASREGVNAQNAVQEAVFRYQSDLHVSDPDNNPAPSQPQLQPYPVYVMTPGSTQPTVIMMSPSGQVQQPARAPAAVPGSRAPAPKAVPTGAPSSAPNPLQAVEGWFQQHFGGGGGAGSQHLTATSKGKPIHSVDGGKTWLPGP
jgi:hypothetical protein